MIGPAISSTHGSGTVDVHLIPTPGYDEVAHMSVSRTRMHPSGLAFIFLFEHGFRHYPFELSHTEPIGARHWNCISKSHVCP